MKITSTDDDMTVHVHTEEIPPVQIIKVNPGFEADLPYETPDDEIMAIGQRSIDAREGTNIAVYDRSYFEHQLLDALAALRFFEREDMN